MQTSQILPSFNYATNCECDDRIFTVELESDLLNILKLLCEYGADLSYKSPNVGLDVKTFYSNGSMAKLLSMVD